MIRVIAQGGFGNQLFCFSFAHWLRKFTSEKIVITQIKKKNEPQRELSDIVCNCSHGIGLIHESWIHKTLKIRDKIESNLPNIGIDQILRLKNFSKISEYEIGEFNSRIYRGFYQNHELVESTFNHFESEISIKIDENFEKAFAKIIAPSEKYICMHFRRGDYLLSKETFGILNLDYYKNNLVDNLPLFITTDDANYVNRLNEEFPAATIISPENFTLWESFSILCNASVLITANSTFSWWAGKFVSARNGRVIAPKPWFKNESNINTKLETKDFEYSKSLFE